MANTVDAIIPKLMARSALNLREMVVMPGVIDRSVDVVAQQKGDNITVPIAAPVTGRAVSPGVVPPAVSGLTPTAATVQLNKWWEAPFAFDDKERAQFLEQDFMPRQIEEALRTLANYVDGQILDMYKKIYGYVGTAQTTPFGSGVGIKDATGIRTTLNKQLAPLNDRWVVLDPDAEGAALELTQFGSEDFAGSTAAIQEGQIGRKLGMQWAMSQNMPTHTKGVATGTPLVNNGAGYPIGTKSLATDGWTNSTTGILVEGDVITFSGHTQTYVVTADVDSGATTGPAMVPIEPGLQAAVVDDEAITVKANHVVNLGVQRGAIMMASRPLANDPINAQLGSIIDTVVDDVSGLVLRLEISRQHYQTQWAFSVLFGVTVVRRDLAVRLAG